MAPAEVAFSLRALTRLNARREKSSLIFWRHRCADYQPSHPHLELDITGLENCFEKT